MGEEHRERKSPTWSYAKRLKKKGGHCTKVSTSEKQKHI